LQLIKMGPASGRRTAGGGAGMLAGGEKAIGVMRKFCVDIVVRLSALSFKLHRSGEPWMASSHPNHRSAAKAATAPLLPRTPAGTVGDQGLYSKQ
jgi:hypothetical protein